MKSNANVVLLDRRRRQREMHRLMAQNSLIFYAAIKDDRLAREDLKWLAYLLDMRVLYGQMRLRCSRREHLDISKAINKLRRAGYLRKPEVRDLDIGFRSQGPEPFWIFELTERELEREWL
jgi:hypothetical protein